MITCSSKAQTSQQECTLADVLFGVFLSGWWLVFLFGVGGGEKGRGEEESRLKA